MFDGSGGAQTADPWADLEAHDVATLARLGRENLVESIIINNRILLLAAVWADAHPGDPKAPKRGPKSMLVERSKRLGGEGTPEVAEGAAFELGVVRDISEGTAEHLIADALDLRHRFPILWAGIVAGGVEGYKGCKIAKATRHLSQDAAAKIDRQLSPFAGQLPWYRLQIALDAAIIAADPEQAIRDAEAAADAQGVWSGQTNHRGLKTVYARTDAEHAVHFMGLINRIADLLKVDGDHRPVDQRRATAIGIIAQPAQVIALLHRHSKINTEPTTKSTATDPSSLFDDPWAGFDWDALLAQFDADPDDDPNPDGPWLEDQQPYQGPADWDDWWKELEPDLGPAGTADEPDFEPDDDRQQDAPGGLSLSNLPAAFDASALRPRVVLHYHLSDTGLGAFGDHTLVRPEHSDPTTFKVLLNFLASTGCQLKIQPVIDPANVAPVDAYEIPDKIRNAVRYRDIADTAPWGTCTSRSMDLDHTKPYQTGGPPGQTAFGQLGPQTRTPHRIKTLGIARVRQPDPGVFFWRTTHGHTAITTNRGTLYLGATDFARALWDLADNSG